MERESQRHAFLITAHNKKAQLKNLLSLLDDPKHDIYIHIDQKAQDISDEELRNCAPQSRVYFTQRMDARWGCEVFIDVIVSLVRLACEEEHAFYHLLSGVDLPIRPLNEIRAYFEAHAGEEFVSFERETAKPEVLQSRVGRYSWQRPVRPFFRILDRHLAPVFAKAQKMLGVNRIKHAKIRFQKGGVWFSITHDLARYVAQQMPQYREYYRHSSCADEIWLQTLVANSPFMEKRAFMGFDDELSATMRYVDWTGGGASPRTLTRADYDMLLQSGMLFARKFDDAVDAEIIQKLSEHVRTGA